ncbi:uncharacterized protein LOC144916169 [Branchiostoma floridae x Branchiostoma belcheri]
MKAAHVVFIVITVSAVDTVIAACTFPANVIGDWAYKTYTPRLPDNVGTLSVNETSMSFFDMSGSLFMQIDCESESGPNSDGIYTTRLFATGLSLRYRCIAIHEQDTTFIRLDLGRDSQILPSLDCTSIGTVRTNIGLFKMNPALKSCPIKGVFEMVYNDNGILCYDPVSAVDSCKDPNVMNISYSECQKANRVPQLSQYQCVANWTSDSVNKGYLLTLDGPGSAGNIPDYHCFVYDVGNFADTGELYLSKAGNPPWLCKASQEEGSSDDGAIAMRLTKREDCNNGYLSIGSMGLIISMCIASLFNAVDLFNGF